VLEALYVHLPLAKKLVRGMDGQAQKLCEEGHQIAPSPGKKPPWVAGFEKSLV